jgi:hypothetical protein
MEAIMPAQFLKPLTWIITVVGLLMQSAIPILKSPTGSPFPSAPVASAVGEFSGDKSVLSGGDKLGTTAPGQNNARPQVAAGRWVTALGSFSTERPGFEPGIGI